MKTNTIFAIIGIIILIIVIFVVSKSNKKDAVIDDENISVDLPLGTGGPDDVAGTPSGTTDIQNPGFPKTGFGN